MCAGIGSPKTPSRWRVHYGFGAHAVVVPALGLARSPLRRRVSKEAVEFVLHLAYGIAVGLVWRAAIRIAI